MTTTKTTTKKRRRVAAEVKAPETPKPDDGEAQGDAAEAASPAADTEGPPVATPLTEVSSDPPPEADPEPEPSDEVLELRRQVAQLQRQVKGMTEDLTKATANADMAAVESFRREGAAKDKRIAQLEARVGELESALDTNAEALRMSKRTIEGLRSREAQLLRAQVDATGRSGARLGMLAEEVAAIIEGNRRARFVVLRPFRQPGATLPEGKIVTAQHYPRLAAMVRQGLQLGQD